MMIMVELFTVVNHKSESTLNHTCYRNKIIYLINAKVHNKSETQHLPAKIIFAILSN